MEPNRTMEGDRAVEEDEMALFARREREEEAVAEAMSIEMEIERSVLNRDL